MAPVAKRFTMDSTGSTSERGTGGRSAASPMRRRSRPRSVARCSDCSSTRWLYSRKMSKRLARGGVLQLEDGLRVEQVVLTVTAPLVLTADVDLEGPRPGRRAFVGIAVPPGHLLGQLGEADAAEPARRRPEVTVHELADQGRSPRRPGPPCTRRPSRCPSSTSPSARPCSRPSGTCGRLPAPRPHPSKPSRTISATDSSAR